MLHGDCRDLVPALRRFDFIFADPPFNIGQAYNGYGDKRSDFEEFTADWIEHVLGRVRWRNCTAMHRPDDLAELYLMAARRLGTGAYTPWGLFGSCPADCFRRSRSEGYR